MTLQERMEAALKRQEYLIGILEKQGADPKDKNAAASTYTQLLREARALAKDGRRWADKLSAEEQRDVIASWFEALPEQQQLLVLQSLTRLHNGERMVG